ncbi:TIR-NBS-LRR resistance protein [Trifolium medium]|uniref:TIR-NBS-LRR resistance protein n=1 Tax=Trifolium medium TaxID=97028 RepID=A0A392M6I5_9FABA|nr:TIR-NBS-LRR resistance protein [Trifolium medium]
MPHWFNNQRVARSISIDPILIILDNDVIGIVCCVVFSAASHDPTTAPIGQTPVLQLRFHSGDLELHFCTPVCTKLIMVESNHMWLTYFTRKSFLKILKDIGNEGSNCIRMEASIVEVEGLDVKSCGYHWVFNEDLQEFNLRTMQAEIHLLGTTSFLAIEDEAQ